MKHTWTFIVDQCTSGPEKRFQSKNMYLTTEEAFAELARIKGQFANHLGCKACALRLYKTYWHAEKCVHITAAQPPPPKPQTSFLHSMRMPHVVASGPRAAFAAIQPQRPSKMSWGIRGMDGCAPCGLGASSDAAYAEAEKVIAENPAGEPPWFIRHWPWVLAGGGLLAAGILYVGTRD